MGAGQSSQSPVASHEVLLERLGGPEAIDYDDAFWHQLLTLAQPLAAEDPARVQATLAGPTRQLLVHNPLTHNFQRLVLHTLDLASAALAKGPSLAVANALRLLAVVIGHMVQTGSPSTLCVSFEVTPGLPASVQGQQSLLPLFINRLVLLICNLQPSDAMSYLVLLEAVLLLLVCGSTQLYTQLTAAPLGSHPLLEGLMGQGPSAAALVTALLALVVTRPPLPPHLQLYSPPAEGGTGVMRLVRTAAATVFWIPLRTYQYIVRSSSSSGSGSGGPGDGPSSPLGDLALSLLLVLAHYPAHHAGLPNGVRDGLRALQDTSGPPDAEGGRSAVAAASPAVAPGPGSGNPTASFARLYDYFATGPHTEASTLLLYTLLHGSRSFQEYVLVRSDPETLLLPVLQQLYGASKARANHLYMLQIIVLILSQDTSFSHNIHKVQLPGSVSWYKERVLTKMSLGSLVYVVLLRTAHKNIGQLQDLYLPTNALAALANLAPQVTCLHSHAAQRLVGLTSAIARRWLKLNAAAMEQQQQEQQPLQPPPEVQVLGDFLRILLEVTNCILSLNLLRNPELVYALLHKQEVFEALRQPGFTELVDNLQAVIDWFNNRLDGVKGGAAAAPEGDASWSVARVLELVAGFSQSWRGDRMKHLPEMRFVYEEEAAPEEFFVPYAWSLTVEATGGRLMSWSLGGAALLTQLSGVEVSGDGSLEHRLSEDPFHSGELAV